MPVSYLSKPVQSSPYVQPLDLNVLAKVLSVKQGSFDEHAQEIQNKIDNLASLDVMKGADRDYLNGKLNNIVNNVNSLGGVDLSDYNVSNQIGGYASSIYSDDRILNAVASTKKARSLMSSYDKMKTDPKLMKYYSPANEYNDTKALNQWANDGQVGTTYQGPTSATPFHDYNKDFQDIMKGIVPNKYTKISNGGGYIEKETGTVVSAKDVYDYAQGLLNPTQRDQMQRDATYLYEAKAHYGKDQMVSKALEHRDQDIQEQKQVLTTLKGSLVDANTAQKANILKQISEKTQYINSLNANRSGELDYYNKLYDNNPTELMYKVYSNDYFNALGRRYAVNQVDKTLTSDQTALETYRQGNLNNRQATMINATARMQAQKDAAAMNREILSSQTQLAVAGIRDSKNNPLAANEDPLATGTINPNTNPADMDVKRANAEQKVNQVNNDLNKVKEDFTNGAIAEHPQMTKEDAKVGFNMLEEELANKARLKDGAISEIPKDFGEKYEQYNVLKFQKNTLQKNIALNQYGRPQYLTKVITPHEQDNVKDANYPMYEAIKSKLLANGSINDPKDVVFQQIYASDAQDGTYKISYFSPTKGKGGIIGKAAVHEYTLSPSEAAALNIQEAPGVFGILNNSVDTGNDFVTHIQNENDHNFIGKIRIYKVKDHEFGAQYLYGDHDAPVNLLKSGNKYTPADAYYAASNLIKKYRAGDTKKSKYQTALDFQKDLSITNIATPQTNGIPSTAQPIQVPVKLQDRGNSWLYNNTNK